MEFNLYSPPTVAPPELLKHVLGNHLLRALRVVVKLQHVAFELIPSVGLALLALFSPELGLWVGIFSPCYFAVKTRFN
jgi:hypothetical protein